MIASGHNKVTIDVSVKRLSIIILKICSILVLFARLSCSSSVFGFSGTADSPASVRSTMLCGRFRHLVAALVISVLKRTALLIFCLLTIVIYAKSGPSTMRYFSPPLRFFMASAKGPKSSSRVAVTRLSNALPSSR